MIITRTPFRISFFGGGTDYPAWYRDNGGAVLSTSIDKYCYIGCRSWPPFFEHKYRVVYSRIELTNDAARIVHPSVRACIDYLDIQGGLEVTHNADLPARTGLGSSSSFTVGLLHALYGLNRECVSQHELASQAIHVEQNIIGENVGSQDQVAAAHGGLNLITFGNGDEYTVRELILKEKRQKELQDHLLLFYSGISRFSSEIAGSKIKNIPKNSSQLALMGEYVTEAIKIITSNRDLADFGHLLHDNWLLKKSLSAKVSNQEIDNMYTLARGAGAIGGKVLGAGGGGFVLFFAKPEHHANIINALSGYLHVPFSMERRGTQIIFFSPQDSYSEVPYILEPSQCDVVAANFV